jgi:hypothetical protein
MKVFLSAEWRRLVNLTYRVPQDKLQPLLPQGCELDLYEGHAHLSLVAFDFVETKVKGLKIPFHVNFPEINLRFYVKAGSMRGVVFIKELVPKHCIALVADRFYNEPYEAYPMESEYKDLEDGGIWLQHELWKDKQKSSITVKAGPLLPVPAENTAAHFFKEHETGFGINKKGETLSYKVWHPLWEVREIQEYDVNFDFERIYGPDWAFLKDLQPHFPLFAEGSAIKVYHPTSLQEALENR